MRLKHPKMEIFIQDAGILNKLQIKSALNDRQEDVFIKLKTFILLKTISLASLLIKILFKNLY